MTMEKHDIARLEELLAKLEAQRAEFELMAQLSHQLFDEKEDAAND